MRRPVFRELLEERRGRKRFGPVDAGSRPCPRLQELEGDDRIERGLPDDRLPGTLRWKPSDNVTVVVPVGLMIVVSIVGTIVLNILLRR